MCQASGHRGAEGGLWRDRWCSQSARRAGYAGRHCSFQHSKEVSHPCPIIIENLLNDLRGWLYRPKLDQLQKDVRGFRALGVILAGRGIEHSAVAVENEGGGDGQFPTIVPIRERQVDKGSAIDRLLLVWHAVDEAKLPGDLVSGIAQ